MTDQEVLRKALNEIDSYRYRWQWSFGVMAAISQAAWIWVMLSVRSDVSERQLIIASTLALACTIFGGVFLLVLLTFRMTHKLLQAIEIAARRD